MKNPWLILLAIAISAPLAAWLGFQYGHSEAAQENRDLQARLNAFQNGIGKAPRSTPIGSDPHVEKGARDPSSAPSPAQILKDPHQSLTTVLNNPDPFERWKQMIAFAENLDPAQIPAALANIDDLPNDETETSLLQFFIFAKLGTNNPTDALLALDDDISDFAEHGFAHESIYGGWSGQDPTAAASHFSKTSFPGEPYPGDNGDRIARAIAANWAMRDPKAAFNWTMSLHKDDRDDAAEAVVGHWVTLNPQAAATAALGAPPGNTRENVLTEVASRWALTDYQAATSWALTLPEDDGTDALVVATRAWANNDLPGATQLADSLADGDQRDRLMIAVANKWDPADPLAGIEWIRSRETSAMAEKHATQSIVSSWAAEDSFAAAQWLATEPPGPGRDGAIVGLTNQIAGEDLERALQWSLTISDPDIREPQLKRHASRWLRNRPETATAWLNAQPDFPPDLRQKLLAEAED